MMSASPSPSSARGTSAAKAARGERARPIYVVNGPNLNMLGEREPEHYGRTSLAEIEAELSACAKAKNVELVFFQSNEEGRLIDCIQDAAQNARALIINAGAYTHSSVALLDALKLLSVPVVEVHLSNIFAREAFRQHSYISPAASGVICGFGAAGYRMALNAILAQTDMPQTRIKDTAP